MKIVKTIKAPKWFLDLYQEAEDGKEKILELASERSGMARMWCDQNFGKCMEKIDTENRKDIDIIIRQCVMAKEYAWARFNYTYLKKEIDPSLPPTYNPKNKTIEIADFSTIEKMAKKIVKKLFQQNKKTQPIK